MTLEERIAELEAENAALHEQLSVVLERVQVLEARLAKDTYTTRTRPGVGLYSVDREGYRE